MKIFKLFTLKCQSKYQTLKCPQKNNWNRLFSLSLVCRNLKSGVGGKYIIKNHYLPFVEIALTAKNQSNEWTAIRRLWSLKLMLRHLTLMPQVLQRIVSLIIPLLQWKEMKVAVDHNHRAKKSAVLTITHCFLNARHHRFNSFNFECIRFFISKPCRRLNSGIRPLLNFKSSIVSLNRDLSFPLRSQPSSHSATFFFTRLSVLGLLDKSFRWQVGYSHLAFTFGLRDLPLCLRQLYVWSLVQLINLVSKLFSLQVLHQARVWVECSLRTASFHEISKSYFKTS